LVERPWTIGDGSYFRRRKAEIRSRPRFSPALNDCRTLRLTGRPSSRPLTPDAARQERTAVSMPADLVEQRFSRRRLDLPVRDAA
jgi:hypothetical protein